MAIELRVDNTGVGRVVLACVHCGEDVGDPGDGLAVWMPGGEPDPVAGTIFCVDYAHRGCEERFQESLPGPDYRGVMNKINLPLVKLFAMLRTPLTEGRGDENHGDT